MNAYVRIRHCADCRQSFRTYEIGEETFRTLRRVVEMVGASAEIINETWATTLEEFEELRSASDEASSEDELVQEQVEHEESELPPNVISILKYFNPREDIDPSQE